ncbi:MAG TPA: hypothetical protein VKU42_00060, partial [Candidatus Angelobacter sp.]|nr:hypothetical protein [Candidatus Angelobacter sp.]
LRLKFMPTIKTAPLEIVDRSTVGVYLPNKNHKEPYRLTRTYARQLRNMNMAFFINHTKDIRLNFTPDPRDIVSGSSVDPAQAIGLNHKKLWNGVTITSPKRTKTKIGRGIENASAMITNYMPPEMRRKASAARV